MNEALEKILQTLADNANRQTELLTALKESNGQDFYTKTPASVHTGVRLHGSTGIFTGPGADRNVISAHVRPHGIAPYLPLIPSIDEDPTYSTLTGFTDVYGDEPDNACEDAPAGYMKGCDLTARFGLARRDTNTIEMDKVMLRVNRGDFTDLILNGELFGMTGLEPSGLNQSQVLSVVTMAEMVGVGVQIERLLSTQLWQGTMAVANQFPGLDVQIATGQVDKHTNTACPALDSDVKSYNYADLDASIVTYLSQLEWFLRYNATTMGLDPVQWVIVMRPDLWYELTAVWPCAYHTNRCSPVADTNSTVFIDGRDNTRERDAMRNGMYIAINGNTYPVVTDTGIFEHNNINNANLEAGEYASTIYMLPLTIRGGFRTTYREYVNYQAAQPDVALLKNMQPFWWTDNGVYSWAFEGTKWCYKLSLKTEQRVILRTPQLAGRIDAVKYSPLQHLREPDPESPYFADGGVSIRSAIGTPYAVWS